MTGLAHRDTEYRELGPAALLGRQKEHESPPHSHSKEKWNDDDLAKGCARRGVVRANIF